MMYICGPKTTERAFMNRPFSSLSRVCICLLFLLNQISCGQTDKPETAPGGWTTSAPRNEIRPAFAYEPTGGREGKACFIIRTDAGDGQDGCWTRPFPVEGGKFYHFSAFYEARSVAVPRRSIVAMLDWRDANGNSIPLDEPIVANYLRGSTGTAETEFPSTRGTDEGGWREVSETYQAPSRASKAIVSLHLQWARDAEVRWSDVSLVETSRPAARKVRLAAVHFRPSGGKDPIDNCRM